MTDAELDAMERALEARLKPWLARASALVRREVDAAKAHAEKAITDGLRQTPDGRPSSRKLRQSPSYNAALGHLDAILDALAGEKVDSIRGLVRDARAAFYAGSVALWAPAIGPEFLATPDPAPTRAGERLMRGAIVHGLDLRSELAPSIDATKRELESSLIHAGRRAATDRDGRDRLAAWHRRGLDRLWHAAARALSDSDKAVHEATGILLLAPEYRGELLASVGDGGIPIPEA